MITEKQKQIIKLLLTNKEGYNVNQISRILDISVSWAHETLKLLEKEGMLISVKIGNAIFYKLNWENPKTEKICDFILLDTNQPIAPKPQNKAEKPLINQDSQPITSSVPKPSYQNFYAKELGQSKGYSPTSNQPTPNIDSPYRQATASQSFDQGTYNVAPVGEKGTNNVLFSYAKSGAFGSSGAAYSSNEGYYGKGVAVPPDSIGSRVSNNISGFTIVQHTSAHKTNVSGCRYCGPESTM